MDFLTKGSTHFLIKIVNSLVLDNPLGRYLWWRSAFYPTFLSVLLFPVFWIQTATRPRIDRGDDHVDQCHFPGFILFGEMKRHLEVTLGMTHVIVKGKRK